MPRLRQKRPPATGSAVARFMLGSLLALAVVVVGGFFALRAVAVDEAERDTRQRVLEQGRLIEALGTLDGLARGDETALRRVDRAVRANIRDSSIVRVKIRSPDGTILYSDEPRLIGLRFAMGEEERELFREGGAVAELSDLSEPENRFERSEGELLEAYTPISTPSGRAVMFEIYERLSAVDANADRLLNALAPPLLAGLGLLLAFQAPLVYSMARRLQRGHREREELLVSAVEASTRERRRIAADLHDGVVQDLAGVAFGLAPLADDADRRGARSNADALRGAVGRLRQGVRDLRTLLVEIHPPNLESAGLEPALSDLLSPLDADGIATELRVEEAGVRGGANDALVYRVAREALRNAQVHAEPRHVVVALGPRSEGGIRLTVRDDGKGFDAEQRARQGAAGHLGLTLLADLVREAGGVLEIDSRPGEGTEVVLELPA